MKFIEEGPGLRAGLKDLPKSLNAGTIGSGLIASIFGCTGPAMVVISAATTVGFSARDTASWLFGIYVFGGLIGCFLSLYYKMPVSYTHLDVYKRQLLISAMCSQMSDMRFLDFISYPKGLI